MDERTSESDGPHMHDRDSDGNCRNCDAGPLKMEETAAMRKSWLLSLSTYIDDVLGPVTTERTRKGKRDRILRKVEQTLPELGPTVVASIVRGACPSCKRGGLAVGEAGHIYCTHEDCTNPRAADQWLRGEIMHPSGVTYPHWDGDTYVRAPGVIQSEDEPGKHLLSVDGENYEPQRPAPVEWDQVRFGDLVEVSVHGTVQSANQGSVTVIEYGSGETVACSTEHTQIRIVQPLAEPPQDLVDTIRAGLTTMADEGVDIRSGDLPYRLARRVNATTAAAPAADTSRAAKGPVGEKILAVLMEQDSCPQAKAEDIMSIFRDAFLPEEADR